MSFVPADSAVESYLLSLMNICYSVSQQFYKKHDNCCLLSSYSFYNTLFFNDTVYFCCYSIRCSQWIQGCGVPCTLLSVMTGIASAKLGLKKKPYKAVFLKSLQ